MDPDLRGCARKGHETYRPTGPGEDRLADRLHVSTPAGEAWRCLRCGTFAVGEPRYAGPAEDAPTVLRGKALRDARILRLLAVERFLRGALLTLAGYALLRFEGSQGSIQQLFDKALPAAKPLANVFDYDLDTSPTVTRLRHLLGTSPHKVETVAILLFAYAATQFLEGVGLALLKRWGEYLSATVTAAFLPLEIYELTDKVTVLKILAFGINILAVYYLVYTKRLFGARGGGRAYEREREGEAIVAVELAAVSDHDPEYDGQDPPDPLVSASDPATPAGLTR